MNQHHGEPTAAGSPANAVPELDWAPAEKYLPAHLLDDDDIMLMPGAFPHAGAVVQLYKHRDTRRYLYLDTLGRAWARANGPDRIQVDLDDALAYLTGRTDTLEPETLNGGPGSVAADPRSSATTEPFPGPAITESEWDATHGVVYDDPPF